MDRTSFSTSIRSAFSSLDDSGILESRISPASLNVSDKFNELALSRSASYKEIYHKGLELGHYNCILKDYAYFQYSQDDRTSWRLAYYPSPYFSGCTPNLIELQDLRLKLKSDEISLIDFEEYVSDGFEAANRVPMLRFEYAEHQHKPVYHPAAHLHIGVDGGDRIASKVKLSPLSFTLLVIRSYYSTSWWSRTSAPIANQDTCVEGKFRSSLVSDGLSRLFEGDEAFSIHLSINFP